RVLRHAPRVLPLRDPAGAAGVAPRHYAEEHGRDEHWRAFRRAGARLLRRAGARRHGRRSLWPVRRVLFPRRDHRRGEPVHLPHAEGGAGRSLTERTPLASRNPAFAQNTGVSPNRAPIPPKTTGIAICVILLTV